MEDGVQEDRQHRRSQDQQARSDEIDLDAALAMDKMIREMDEHELKEQEQEQKQKESGKISWRALSSTWYEKREERRKLQSKKPVGQEIHHKVDLTPQCPTIADSTQEDHKTG